MFWVEINIQVPDKLSRDSCWFIKMFWIGFPPNVFQATKFIFSFLVAVSLQVLTWLFINGENVFQVSQEMMYEQNVCEISKEGDSWTDLSVSHTLNKPSAYCRQGLPAFCLNFQTWKLAIVRGVGAAKIWGSSYFNTNISPCHVLVSLLSKRLCPMAPLPSAQHTPLGTVASAPLGLPSL